MEVTEVPMSEDPTNLSHSEDADPRKEQKCVECT